MTAFNSDKVGAATLSVISNTVLVLGKITAGIMTGSVSILSEAIHSGIDLLAAIIAFFSVRESGKPADERHQYGHGKIENISGTVEAVLIIIAAVWIMYEAVGKLLNQSAMGEIGWGIAVMGISALTNALISTKLMRTAKATDSVALKADALHLRTDVYTSAGVLLGLTAIKLTGIDWLDPVAALGVALLIIKTGFALTRQAFLPLVDVSLPAEEEDVIIDVIRSFAGRYVSFHKLRTRKAGSDRHIDLHLVVAKDSPVHEVHALCDEIETALKQKLSGVNVLIHIEPCEAEQCHDCPPSGCAGRLVRK